MKEEKVVSYNQQTLQLSKIFANWPDEIEVGEDGTVKKAETAKK